MSSATREEAILHHLAENSFLRFWSWPNLYRNQGDSHNGGDGKEICDLVVFFGKDILLFSDKRISFSEQHDINIAWSRWARKAISESHKQLIGAQRWIKNFPERIFLDSKCREIIPLEIPTPSTSCFHHILVCHGIEDYILKHNDEPSFLFNNSLSESDNWSHPKAIPFTIGNISKQHFVHVFNEATIELVLKEFDTIKDFLLYLKERQTLLRQSHITKVKSESDIVQLYYESFDENQNKRDILTTNELAKKIPEIDKGGIKKLYSNSLFVYKKSNDKVSYFWDNLIQSFSFHILNNSTSYKSWTKPSEIEPALRVIAETSRFDRRVLSNGFLEFYRKAQPNQRGTRMFFDPSDPSLAYLFFLHPQIGKYDDDTYRSHRRQLLEKYCIIAKLEKSDIQKIVGIAAKTRDNNIAIDNSFFDEGQDFLFLDFSEWGEEKRISAEKLKNELISNGLLGNRKEIATNDTEFRHNTLSSKHTLVFSGSDRNKKCPCGSGKKVKKCCGFTR